MNSTYTFYFLDHTGSRRIRKHQVITDSGDLADQMCRQWLFQRWPNFVLLPVDSLRRAAAFIKAVMA